MSRTELKWKGLDRSWGEKESNGEEKKWKSEDTTGVEMEKRRWAKK